MKIPLTARNKYGERFRWEIRWEVYLHPFYERDYFLDGGSIMWHFGFMTLYKWIIHE